MSHLGSTIPFTSGFARGPGSAACKLGRLRAMMGARRGGGAERVEMTDEVAKVILLRSGVEITSPGHPDENLIKGIEWLLERAKSGELIGITYVVNHADGACTGHFIGSANTLTVGHLTRLASRISFRLDHGS